MSDKDWLESLKPGDLVVVERIPQQEALAKVERVTKTQIIAENGRRFRRKNGRSIGSTTWTHSWLRRPDGDALVRITRKGHVDTLKHSTNWDALTTEQLGEVIALLKSFGKEQG